MLALAGNGFVERTERREAALTFRDFVSGFFEPGSERVSELRIDAISPSWRGLKLGAALVDGFYAVAQGERPATAAEAGPFADPSCQAAMLAERAAAFVGRGVEVRAGVIRPEPANPGAGRRGPAGAEVVHTHEWTARGWRRRPPGIGLSKAAWRAVLLRVPPAVRLAEA